MVLGLGDRAGGWKRGGVGGVSFTLADFDCEWGVWTNQAEGEGGGAKGKG